MRHFNGTCILLAALVGCSGVEMTGPASVTPTPRPQDPALDKGMVLSSPIGPNSVGAHLLVGGGSSMNPTIFVSMVPGTVPHGESVTITNLRSGTPQIAPVFNGGFDPVAIVAAEGDSIGIKVVRDDGGKVETTEVVRSVRPPTVVRSNPPKGQTDVPVNASLIVVFSEPVLPASVTSSSVALVAGNQTVGGIVRIIGASGYTVEFVPDQQLIPVTNYALRLESSVTGLSGNSLEAPVTVNFTTVAPAGPEPIASVSVVPGSPTMIAGSALQFLAFPKNAAGAVLSGRQITWSSSNQAVARVTSDGTVSAVASGNVTITAKSEGVTGSSSVTVTTSGAPVASVYVDPPTIEVLTTGRRRLTAILQDRDFNNLTGRNVVWESSDPTVVSVTSSGDILAIAAGVVTITATSEGKTGSSIITVLPSSPAPNTPIGSLKVTVNTTGTDLDPDGYALALDDLALDQVPPGARTVQLNDTKTIQGLLASARRVWLTDVDPNCSVDGAERTVTIPANAEASVTFNVTCTPRANLPSNDPLVGVWQAVKIEYFRDQAHTSRAAELVSSGWSASLLVGAANGGVATWQWHVSTLLTLPNSQVQTFMVFDGSLSEGANTFTAQVDHSSGNGCVFYGCSSLIIGPQAYTRVGDDIVITGSQITEIWDDTFGYLYYWTRLTLKKVR